MSTEDTSNTSQFDGALFVPPVRPCLLVIDDQPTNIKVLYQILSNDYQVLMATNGEEALALCEKRPPDLILLDLVMPVMDGFQVCQRLKTNPTTRDIPVIIITAQTDQSAEEKGFDLGAADFMIKPINPRILRERVKTHLRLKTQRDVLRSFAYLDGLTGVHNRLYFDERFSAEMGRAVRNQSNLSLIVLDIDFFKRYNTHYGHLSGDECLRRLAGILKNSLMRPCDYVARYGGEEFVCLLPDTNFSGAMQLAEQIRKKILDHHIAHSQSSIAPFLTVSVGVASKPESVRESSLALLQLADTQLLKAKENGRHQVCGAELSSKPS